MSFSFEGGFKAFTKYLVAGSLAVLPVQIYLQYVEPVVRQRDYLTFYEYRRKLLNCYKEYDRDYTNCAADYLNREKSSNYLDRERYFSANSYEQFNIPRIELQDAFFNFDNWMFAAIAGAALGGLGYSRIYSRFLHTCPPEKLQYVYWRVPGIKFTKALFNKYRNANFITNGRVTGCNSSFVLPYFQKIGEVDLKPYKVEFVNTFATKDGNKVTVRADLTLQMQEIEEDDEIFFKAARLMNLSDAERIERTRKMLQFALKKVCDQVSTDEMNVDKELFYIYLQQRMGQTLLELGVRVVRCDIIGYECDPQKDIGFVGGNISNTYTRKCKMWVSWVFRFIFSIGRISFDWKQWRKP